MIPCLLPNQINLYLRSENQIAVFWRPPSSLHGTLTVVAWIIPPGSGVGIRSLGDGILLYASIFSSSQFIYLRVESGTYLALYTQINHFFKRG